MKDAEAIQTINQHFEAYEDLQHRHLDMLQTEALPDLAMMTQERKLKSQTLQQSLTRYTQTAPDDLGITRIDRLKTFETRLGQILELDGIIRDKIKTYRDNLKRQLNQLKHGRTAIQGYRPADSGRNKPRVLKISR